MEPTRTKTRIFAAFLCVLGCGTATHAETSVVGSTSTLLGSRVTSSGIYDITLSGAQGGRGAFTNGGLGAAVEGEGDIFLSAGTRLTIVVGGHGHTNLSVNSGVGCVYSSRFGALFAATRGSETTGDTIGGGQRFSGSNWGAAAGGGVGSASGGASGGGNSGRTGSSGINRARGNGSVSINDLSAFPPTPEMDSWVIGAGLFALLGFEFVRRKVANQRLGGSL